MGSANLVLHIPHASRLIPLEERRALIVNDETLRTELLRMTDAHTDELFPVTSNEAGRVVFPLSRLVCDVERFPEDVDEAMAAHGMGAVYTRTSQGEALRTGASEGERRRLLTTYYHPHHATLATRVEEVLSAHAACVVVDCHSFASVALPHEGDQSAVRPDICIGTDPVHTPKGLRDAAIAAAVSAGYTVTVNRPFAGSIVPARCQKEFRVLSLMIEVNRGLYMNERTGGRTAPFDAVRCALAAVLERLSDWAAGSGSPKPPSRA